MTEPLIHHYYEPTDTILELFDDSLIVARFGHATATLEENTAESIWVKARYDEMMEKHHDQPVYVLMDLSKIDNSEYNSDESNKIYLQMLRDKRIEKIAIFGLHSGWELFINMFTFYVKNKIHIFTTEPEARAWIEKKRQHAAH